MVSQEQLREHLGRRPFQPFRVRLTGGESVEVFRIAQAVAMPTRLVVSVDDRLKWIPLDRIDSIDVYELRTN